MEATGGEIAFGVYPNGFDSGHSQGGKAGQRVLFCGRSVWSLLCVCFCIYRGLVSLRFTNI